MSFFTYNLVQQDFTSRGSAPLPTSRKGREFGPPVYSGQWYGMLVPHGDSSALLVRSVDMQEPVGLIAFDHSYVNLLV